MDLSINCTEFIGDLFPLSYVPNWIPFRSPAIHSILLEGTHNQHCLFRTQRTFVFISIAVTTVRKWYSLGHVIHIDNFLRRLLLRLGISSDNGWEGSAPLL